MPIRDLRSAFAATPDRIDVTEFRARVHDVPLTGTGVYGWDGNGRATAAVGPADLATAPADMRRVQNVTYDLVVARERNLAPAETVYRKSGLPRPEHRLATPLEPDARYFWTIRARFLSYSSCLGHPLALDI